MIGVLFAVALRADPGAGLGPADWSAIRFTVWQAILSASCSVLLAIPVARGIARRRFWGRRVLIALMGAPFILPVIVAILGILVVFGRSGWISDLLVLMGQEPLRIYGLQGVVLAHVFFNLPLATRLILQGWQEIPAERFRLAAQLNVDGPSMWRLLEWPMLRQVVPGAFAVIFAICLSSFAVALTLGGGPRATTIELAIYEAFRLEFDLGRAALLSGLQLVLTGLAAFVALRMAIGEGFGSGLDRPLRRWDGQAAVARGLDVVWITAAGLFLVLPLAAIVLSGIPGLLSLSARSADLLVRAAGNSLVISATSTLLMLVLVVPMTVAIALRPLNGGGVLAELAGLLGLAVSPLVIGTGLFIVLFPFVDPFALALPVTALVNALMALPFALRILVPRVRDILARYGRLALSLDLQGWTFMRVVLLPRLRPQLGFAAGLAAALSMGDLGVIALFSDSETATLPLQVYRLMGAYRTDAAAAGALLLLCLSVGMFYVLDRGGRRHAET